MKTTNDNRSVLKPVEALKNSKGIQVSPDKRSLLREDVTRVQRGITPSNPSINGLPFLMLLTSFVVFRKWVVDNGGRFFNADSFLLLCVLMYAGKAGISVTLLSKAYCVHISASTVRNVQYKLDSLIGLGLVVVSPSGRYKSLRYSCSVHAEKLFTSKVSKADLKYMRDEINALLKSQQ